MIKTHRLLALAALLLPLEASAEKTYLAWAQRYSTTLNSTQRTVAVTTDPAGNPCVTGYIDVSGNDTIYIAKYDALTGAVLWECTYDGAAGGDDVPAAIACDANGNVVVTGRSLGSGTGNDFITLKYGAASGALLWEKRYNNSASDGQDEATALVVTPGGDVIVTGRSVGPSVNFDFHTIKYAASNGSTLWQRRYSTSFDDTPRALALRPDGEVVVTGFSRVGANQCFYTACYGPAAGAIVWERTLDAISNKDDQAFDVAVDSAGDVAVVGTVILSSGAYAFLTVKYGGAAGDILWQRFYAAPVSSFTNPTGIAFDAQDRVVIAGASRNAGDQEVIYLAKYARTTGAIVWEVSEPSPGVEVTGLALDRSGHVFIAASAPISPNGRDYIAAKFASDTGAILWARGVQGERPDGDDNALGLVLDGGGDVVLTGTSRKPSPSAFSQMLTVKIGGFPFTTGDLVSGPGLSENASIAKLNAPALADDGGIAVRAQIKDGGKNVFAILDAPGRAPFVQGQAAPGLGANAKFASFLDPVLSPGGALAFTAKLSGVPAAEATCVFHSNGAEIVPALQTGKAAPGLPAGVLVKSIAAISRQDDLLVALVKLKGAGVTAATATAILRLGPSGLALTPIRTGDVLDGSTITKLSVFTPTAASPGDGRWHGRRQLAFVATTADLRTHLCRVGSTGPVFAALSKGDLSPVAVDTIWNSAGLPAIAGSEMNFAISTRATLKPGAGGVTKANDTVVVHTEQGGAFTALAREGGAVNNISGATFTGFSDPVLGMAETVSDSFVAFLGTFKGAGITLANNTALFYGPNAASMNSLVRLGDLAPDASGATDTAVFAKITNVALPTAPHTSGLPMRPFFLATLKGPGITQKNNAGLWAIGSAFSPRRLLRTGDVIEGRPVAKFGLLGTTPGVLSARRSFHQSGGVVALVTFTDGTQSVLRLALP